MTTFNEQTTATSDVCTIGQYIEHLAPAIWRGKNPRKFPDWPPDMFAIAGSLLNVSGAYRKVLSREALEIDWKVPMPSQTWKDEMTRIGTSWREKYPPLTAGMRYPKEIGRWWKTLTAHGAMPLDRISWSSTVYCALFNLLAASDEACVGIGYPQDPTVSQIFSSPAHTYFVMQAYDILDQHRNSPYGMTLCDLIHPSRVRVLPKLHTPRIGMTLRSLSLHLALCPADEVKIIWSRAYGLKRPTVFSQIHNDSLLNVQHMNILLLPWPMEVNPSDIQALPDGLDGAAHNPQRLFTYDPIKPLSYKGMGVIELTTKLFDRATEIIGDGGIHGIILPELALTSAEYEELKSFAFEKSLMLISGIRGKSNGFATNQVGIYLGTTDLTQSKHHRWLLDANQIAAYGLVSKLHPDSEWWEGIEIAHRELRCVAVNDWLCLCALICEDLARQEPMARAVRAIGPSLLVALLMDGPQLSMRWPSHYATVLADDPGSSVLTFTSLGMVKLSNAMRPSTEYKVRRTVALWKDRQTGIVEIDINATDDALILCLTNKSSKEVSADGRVDRRNDNLLVLGGVHPIRLPDAPPQRNRAMGVTSTSRPKKRPRLKSSAETQDEHFSS